MKKSYLSLLVGLLFSVFAVAQNNPFITKWKFGSYTNSIQFYAIGEGSVDYKWSHPGKSGSGSFTAPVIRTLINLSCQLC